MKIAIAQEGTTVCQHFGHCEQFALYDQEANRWSMVDNPDHQPGFLPGFLRKLGADVIIAGGMGARAQELFVDLGMEVVVGASGPVPEVVDQFLKGELKSSGETCSEHQHLCGDDHHHEHGCKS